MKKTALLLMSLILFSSNPSYAQPQTPGELTKKSLLAGLFSALIFSQTDSAAALPTEKFSIAHRDLNIPVPTTAITGDPVLNLTPGELSFFTAGKTVFLEVENVPDG